MNTISYTGEEHNDKMEAEKFWEKKYGTETQRQFSSYHLLISTLRETDREGERSVHMTVYFLMSYL